jgi:outer membrane protein assembly factor BamB
LQGARLLSPRAPYNLVRPAGDPDDISVAADGSLWVSDTDDNAVIHLSSTGAVLGRIDDAHSPEGLVVLPDGRLVVADQADNQITVVTSSSGAPAKVLDVLAGAAGQLGVDGIGYDAADGRLLVPDSPTGRLYAVSPDTGDATLLASGMGRIVDAALGPDGAIYVVGETARGLLRVPAAGGTAVQVGSLTDLDDVVALDGLLYVTDLGGSVWAVDPATGRQREIVSDADAPQGLASVNGRLVLVDEVAPCCGVDGAVWLSPPAPRSTSIADFEAMAKDRQT